MLSKYYIMKVIQFGGYFEKYWRGKGEVLIAKKSSYEVRKCFPCKR